MQKDNLKEILNYNGNFVKNREYEKYQTSKAPDMKIAILTCMDTRLVELLPQAMNIKNGDAKIIKNAGGIVTHPFGSVMRSLIVAVYKLGVKEIYVIPHYDCGVCKMDTSNIKELMKKKGVVERDIQIVENSGVDIEKWLHGFDDINDSLEKSVSVIKNHPLMPRDIPVHGLVIDPITGKLDLKIDGWKNIG